MEGSIPKLTLTPDLTQSAPPRAPCPAGGGGRGAHPRGAPGGGQLRKGDRPAQHPANSHLRRGGAAEHRRLLPGRPGGRAHQGYMVSVGADAHRPGGGAGERSSRPRRRRGWRGLFHRAKDSLENLKLQYSKAEENVDRIVQALEGHQGTADEGHRRTRSDVREEPPVLQGAHHVPPGRANRSSKKSRRAPFRSFAPRRKRAAGRRTPRPPMTTPTVWSALKRSSTTWSSPELVSSQMGPQIRMIQK